MDLPPAGATAAAALNPGGEYPYRAADVIQYGGDRGFHIVPDRGEGRLHCVQGSGNHGFNGVQHSGDNTLDRVPDAELYSRYTPAALKCARRCSCSSDTDQ